MITATRNSPLLALTITCLLFTLTGCVNLPKGITPVQSFDVNRYLGNWYEVARLDHSFERGMQQISANYTIRESGGLNVINRGFLTDEMRWKEAKGKAYFVEGSDIGYLKVSFFGPFYGAYIIFELDTDYQYAFITSSSREYLWFLSRTPTVSDELMTHFLSTANRLGFNTSGIIHVTH